MKYISFIFILALLLGCSSDDSSDNTQGETNTSNVEEEYETIITQRVLSVDNDGWYPSRILTQDQCSALDGEWVLGEKHWNCSLKYNDAKNFCQTIGGRLPTFDELSAVWYDTKNNDPLAQVINIYAPKGFIDISYLSSELIVSGDTTFVKKMKFDFENKEEPLESYLSDIDQNDTFNFRCKSDVSNVEINNSVYFEQLDINNTFMAEKTIDATECSNDYKGEIINDDNGNGCRIFQSEMNNYCALQGGKTPSIDDFSNYWEDTNRTLYPQLSTLQNRYYWSDIYIQLDGEFDKTGAWDFSLGKVSIYGGSAWLASPICVSWNKEDAYNNLLIPPVKMSKSTCEEKFGGTSYADFSDDQRDSCEFDWNGADEFCKTLNGRLPTTTELIEASQNGDNIFVGTSSYWTSETETNYDQAMKTVTVSEDLSSSVSWSDIHATKDVRCIVNN